MRNASHPELPSEGLNERPSNDVSTTGERVSGEMPVGTRTAEKIAAGERTSGIRTHQSQKLPSARVVEVRLRGNSEVREYSSPEEANEALADLERKRKRCRNVFWEQWQLSPPGKRRKSAFKLRGQQGRRSSAFQMLLSLLSFQNRLLASLFLKNLYLIRSACSG